MARYTLSYRSKLQIGALLVAAIAVAVLRGHPFVATGFIVSTGVAVLAVQRLGKDYDRPLPWWLFVLMLVAAVTLVWFP